MSSSISRETLRAFAVVHHDVSWHLAQSYTAREVMTLGIDCCREDDDLAKPVRHMEALKIRRLPVINKSRRMVGILSLGDISDRAPGDLLSECVKSISAHHH
jgi:CBS-domain-containing membrane protein